MMVFLFLSPLLIAFDKKLQYDTIYHEHLRYYSVQSLKFLFEKHNLEIIDTKEIPTHGGSIRVYAARKGKYIKTKNVSKQLDKRENI